MVLESRQLDSLAHNGTKAVPYSSELVLLIYPIGLKFGCYGLIIGVAPGSVA